MERREYTRISTKIPSKLRLSDERTYSGVVVDLSFGGAYLECNELFPIDSSNVLEGTNCVLQLTLELDGSTISADIRCQLVDTSGRRAGVRFTGLDHDSYQHLRTFMLRNASDPESLIREVRLYPNPAFPREAKGPKLSEWIKGIFQG